MKNKTLMKVGIFILSLIGFGIVCWVFSGLAITSSMCACENLPTTGGPNDLFIECDAYCFYLFGIKFTGAGRYFIFFLGIFIQFLLPIILAIISTKIVSKRLQLNNK